MSVYVGGARMRFYECHLLGSAGEIRFCESIESDSDSSALALCRTILAARRHHASFELWSFQRLIWSEGRLAA
jgi:hypothetical protein